jgi:pSer/pThr/pTyr-binding forkhead associated (FHA) protein
MDALVLGAEAAADPSADRITVFTVVQPVPEGAPYVVGSGSGCALRVAAASVSRVHALLRKEGHRWFMEDAGSSAGTWVNGVALDFGARKALAPGDRLSFGSLDFTFLPSEDFHAYARARSKTYAVS